MKVKVLVRDDCPLCDEAVETAEDVVEGTEATLTTENVDRTPALRELYGDEVPVVMIDGVAEFRLYLDEDELRDALGLET